MEKNNSLFRKSSLEHFSSPEQLDDYLKVTNPGVWVGLAALGLFILGVLVWSIFGNLSVRETFEGTALDGVVTVHCSMDQSKKLQVGETGTILGEECKILQVVGPDERGRVEVKLATDLPDGAYSVELVTERIRPMSFVTN